MKKFYSFILCLTSFIYGTAQTTLSIVADKDNTIFSGAVNNSNGAGIYFFAGRNGASNGNSIQRALLHFNLGNIPAGSTITSATLSLFCNKVGFTTTGIALYKLTSDWGEGTSDAEGNEGPGVTATTGDATWNQRFYPTSNWSTPGGSYISTFTTTTAAVNAGTTVSVSGAGLLADVQNMVNNPTANFGWLIAASDEEPTNTAKRFVSRNNSIAAQRPTLNITYTASLPVNLKGFSATLKTNNAVLVWKTATEINNKYFDVEHSVNGVNFTSVGRVTGGGSSSTERTYTFIHATIAKGKNYYRLAQYDLNGDVKYSQVIVLSANGSVKLQIKPNPATSVITVTASSAIDGSQYSIRSSTGQVIKKGILSSQQINVQQLSAGQYYLILESAGEILQSTFIKK